MDPRDPEPQPSPVSRAPAARPGVVIAAAVLGLVAAGIAAGVVSSRVRATQSTPAAGPRTAASPAPAPVPSTAPPASRALDPLVQAMAEAPLSSGGMSLEATLVTSGGHVRVSFDHPVSSAADGRTWIAIAKIGSPDSSYETWTYVEDKAQSAELAAPIQPGEYEMRLHDDYPRQSFHVVARIPFHVETGLAEDPSPPRPLIAAEHFSLSATTVARGKEIVITFPEPLVAKQGERYWIAITQAGEADSSYGAWAYVQASATKTSLQAPRTAGNYEVRLHGNYPTKSTNVVYRVPFKVD